jgi:hypothetical protein
MATTILLGLTSSPAGATSATVTAQQFNMCSAKCGNHTAAANLASYFNTTAPWATSLNEVCASDPLSLHYTALFFATKYSVAGCPGGTFGIEVSAAGYTGANFHYAYTAQAAGIPANCSTSASYECRQMICVKANVFGLLDTTCATHLMDDTSISIPEAGEYAFAGAAYAAGQSRFLSGDFNQTPGQLPGAYTPYLRSVVGNTIEAPSPSEIIDYIEGYPGSANSSPAPYCSYTKTQISDHCFAFAQFTMTF